MDCFGFTSTCLVCILSFLLVFSAKMANFTASQARDLILDSDFEESQDSSDEFVPTSSDMDTSTSESLPKFTEPVRSNKRRRTIRTRGVGLGQGVGHIMYRIRLHHRAMFNREVRAMVGHVVGLVVSTEDKKGGLQEMCYRWGKMFAGPNDNNNQNNVQIKTLIMLQMIHQ